MSARLIPSTPVRGLAALALLVVLVVGACSGAATTAPSGGGSSAAPTTGESAPAASSPTGTEGASSGPVDFGGAATGLDKLDSYQFSVTMQAADTSGGTAAVSNGTTTFSGTVINKPDKAQTLDMVTKDANGNLTDATSIVLLPGTAYMKSGVSGTWTQVPAAQADIFAQALSAFRPEQLFSLYFVPGATDNTVVGDEQKNGVACTHYRGGQAIGAILSAIAGVSGTWSSDVWLAKDGGYLVHSEAAVAAATATSGGSFSIVVDISNINSSSNAVTAPM